MVVDLNTILYLYYSVLLNYYRNWLESGFKNGVEFKVQGRKWIVEVNIRLIQKFREVIFNTT